MKAIVTKYGKVAERIGARMTRAQAFKLKALAEEAYQPQQYAANLTSEEPDRRAQGGNSTGGFVLNLPSHPGPN